MKKDQPSIDEHALVEVYLEQFGSVARRAAVGENVANEISEIVSKAEADFSKLAKARARNCWTELELRLRQSVDELRRVEPSTAKVLARALERASEKTARKENP